MSTPAPAANQEALDSTGNPIVLGSIVAITLDIYPWDEYQALVVSLDSTECPEGGPIAVYFDREVDGHHFHPVTSRIPEWDAAHKAVTLDLLLSNQLWKRSPRVRHFLPTDLRVDAEWKIESLAGRTFPGRNYNALYDFREKPVLGSKPCPMRDCKAGASAMGTHIILINANGCVFPMVGCSSCWKEFNGSRRDCLPALKQSIKS